MRQIGIATVITFLGLLASACGCTSAPPASVDAGQDATPDGDLPAVVDVSPSIDDGALEAGGLDVPAVDAPAAIDVSAPCTTNAACAGSAEGPACDTATGRCVPCTAASDLCPAGQYCVPGMNRCASGCRDDLACREARDGGVVERRCNPDTRACVDCLRDEHCAAGSLCVGNTCVPGCTATRACPSGQTCCGGACADPQTSTANCGACDRRCTVTNGVPVCRGGACGLAMCVAPFADCDGNTANGCESNTATSATHCGACSSACAAHPNSTVSCEMGTCRYVCTASFGDCDGNAANGCETNLNSALAHCGACGRACSLPNATATCAAGSCAIASCAPGFGDCNGNVADGCEVDTRTSVGNCGTCGHACTVTNATASCVAGSCGIGACTSLYDNCDGNAANGCEASLLATTSCGACGTSCPAGGPHTVSRCQAGSGSTPARCSISCESGWTDCNANVADGCEAMGSCTVDRVLFYDDFESGDGLWTRDPVWRYGAGSFYSPCAGTREMIGERLVTGPCVQSGDLTLITPIDVSRATSLNLYHRSRSARGASSGLTFYMSTDGGRTWINLGNQNTATCGLQSIPLSSFVGASTMLFRFSLYSGACETTFWRLDEVRLQATVRNY